MNDSSINTENQNFEEKTLAERIFKKYQNSIEEKKSKARICPDIFSVVKLIYNEKPKNHYIRYPETPRKLIVKSSAKYRADICETTMSEVFIEEKGSVEKAIITLWKTGCFAVTFSEDDQPSYSLFTTGVLPEFSEIIPLSMERGDKTIRKNNIQNYLKTNLTGKNKISETEYFEYSFEKKHKTHHEKIKEKIKKQELARLIENCHFIEKTERKRLLYHDSKKNFNVYILKDPKIGGLSFLCPPGRDIQESYIFMTGLDHQHSLKPLLEKKGRPYWEKRWNSFKDISEKEIYEKLLRENFDRTIEDCNENYPPSHTAEKKSEKFDNLRRKILILKRKTLFLLYLQTKKIKTWKSFPKKHTL